MDCNRTKICLCYLITSFLISIFIYVLISSNLSNSRKLNRLRDEVDEIAHIVLHGAGDGKGDPKHLSELVDALLKKRLAGIWDDLYTLKKQVRVAECNVARTSGSVQPAKSRVNYAAEELGAKIYEVKAQPVGSSNIVRNMLGLEYSANPPVNMLRSNMDPGNCFGFRKNVSEVTIKLAKPIFLENFEVEHICSRRAPKNDTSSAPKVMEVSFIGMGAYTAVNRLGTFTYDNSPQAPVQSYAARSTSKAKYLRIKFQCNHGHPDYTCVYRVAVFGREE